MIEEKTGPAPIMPKINDISPESPDLCVVLAHGRLWLGCLIEHGIEMSPAFELTVQTQQTPQGLQIGHVAVPCGLLPALSEGMPLPAGAPLWHVREMAAQQGMALRSCYANALKMVEQMRLAGSGLTAAPAGALQALDKLRNGKARGGPGRLG